MFIRYIIITLLSIAITPWSTSASEGGQPNQANIGSGSVSDAILGDVDRGKEEAQEKQTDYAGFTKEEYRKLQEQHRFYIIIGLIIATPIFLLILLYFIKQSQDYTEHAIIHASGLVLVIQATAIVVIASPTTEQLTAAIGVLAAIAGYLFGTAKKVGKES